MILNIDYALVMKAWGEYLFDPETFLLYEKDASDSSSRKLMEFPRVNDRECKKAFIDSFNDKELSERFGGISDAKEFEKSFWEYTDDGGERFSAYSSFEKQYALGIITEWCENNNIPCYIDSSDVRLKFFLKK